MALTVGELNAILNVESKDFEDKLKKAKKSLEQAAAEADEFGDETKRAMDKSSKASKKADREIKNITKTTKKAKNPMEKLGKSIGTAFKVGVVLAFGKKIAEVTMQMANLALEATESAAAFEITFGSAAKETTKFINEMSHAFGMTRAEMQQQMAVTGSVIQGLGFTSDAAADMSTNIMNLSGDLAAFMNIQEGAVVPANAITKALTGEREMLKSMGIVLRQVEVDQKALVMADKERTSELTQQERAAASLVLIQEKMGHIQGQLGREMKGAANQMRSLRAEFKEAQTEVGQALLPAFATFIPVVRELIPTFKEVMATVARFVEVLLLSLMPVIEPVKKIFSSLSPIIELLTHNLGFQLTLAFKVIAEVLSITLIPILNALASAAEFVMNAFGILTSQQEEYLRTAETAEGILFRLNEALEAGTPPADAMAAALDNANDIGIESADIMEDMTQAAYGFSESRRAVIKEEIKAAQAQLELMKAQQAASYQGHLYEKGIERIESNIRKLELELHSNYNAQQRHSAAQRQGVTDAEDYSDAKEEETEAVEKNTISLQENTQSKLNNLSIQNESIAAMLNLVTAIKKVTEIQGREAAEQEKLNKLYAQRADLQKILNEEAGKGEEQTAAELAMIAKLKREHEGLLTQQQKGLDLKLEIASAELDLEDAIMSRDEKGEEADARDDLSIKQSRQRLDDLRHQQATSKDVTIELAQAQENLDTAITNSTMATGKYIAAQQGMERLNTRITDQARKRDEAAIDTDAERLELTEAKLALEAATITAQDKGIMKEARSTLARVMGLNSQGVDDLFKSLGLDLGSFGRLASARPFEQMLGSDAQFLPPRPNPEEDLPDTETETTIPNLTDFGKSQIGGGGLGGNVFSNSGIGNKVFGNWSDSDFDLGNSNSTAARYLKERDTIVNVIVDPALDAQTRIDKQLADINDRLQTGSRFRVL